MNNQKLSSIEQLGKGASLFNKLHEINNRQKLFSSKYFDKWLTENWRRTLIISNTIPFINLVKNINLSFNSILGSLSVRLLIRLLKSSLKLLK